LRMSLRRHRRTWKSRHLSLSAPRFRAPWRPSRCSRAGRRCWRGCRPAERRCWPSRIERLPRSKHITTSEWVAYRIDQYISTRKGQTATLSLLGLLLMTLGGIFLKAVRPSTAFRETVWEAWTFLADSGSHTTLVEEVRTWFVCMQVLERVRLIKRCGLVLSAGPTRGGRAHESRRHLVLLRHHGVRRGRNSSEDGHAEEREIQRRGDEAHSKWRCVRSEKSLACFD